MADLEHILHQLHDSEINAGVQTFYDAGMRVWIGDEANGIQAETTIERWRLASRSVSASRVRLRRGKSNATTSCQASRLAQGPTRHWTAGAFASIAPAFGRSHGHARQYRCPRFQ
jgi:hypothetical protein